MFDVLRAEHAVARVRVRVTLKLWFNEGRRAMPLVLSRAITIKREEGPSSPFLNGLSNLECFNTSNTCTRARARVCNHMCVRVTQTDPYVRYISWLPSCTVLNCTVYQRFSNLQDLHNEFQ